MELKKKEKRWKNRRVEEIGKKETGESQWKLVLSKQYETACCLCLLILSSSGARRGKRSKIIGKEKEEEKKW